MLSSACRFLARIVACVAAAYLIVATPVSAQTPNQAVDQFLANPNQVLQQFTDGGPRLISVIRDTVLTHPEALQNLIALLKTANKEQQSAFGSAFGQAAQITVRTNQAYATQIQQAIADSGSDDANTAFAAVTGNVTIAATGGGGGGGGGGGAGVGGPTGNFGLAFGGTNTGGTGTSGALNYTTSTQTFTGGGGGVGGGATTIPVTGDTTTTAVSPR